MGIRLALALVAMAPITAGCAGFGATPRDAPALDPPISVLEPGAASTARLVVYVLNESREPTRLVISIGERRILRVSIPTSVDQTGHPPIHRFRYTLASGDHPLTVMADGEVAKRVAHLPSGAVRWLVIQCSDNLPVEAEIFDRRPVFG